MCVCVCVCVCVCWHLCCGNWVLVITVDDVATDTTRVWDNPFTNQIRLNGSSHVTNGLVEVYCNGQWGTICDDGFNSYAADTICIQLGYTEGTYSTGPV